VVWRYGQRAILFALLPRGAGMFNLEADIRASEFSDAQGLELDLVNRKRMVRLRLTEALSTLSERLTKVICL
jgi:hypothetical protein